MGHLDVLRTLVAKLPGVQSPCVRSFFESFSPVSPPLVLWMAPQPRAPPRAVAHWCLRLVFTVLLCGVVLSSVCELATPLARNTAAAAAASPFWRPPRRHTCDAALWPLPCVTVAAAAATTNRTDSVVLPSCVAAGGRQSESLAVGAEWSCAAVTAAWQRGGPRETALNAKSAISSSQTDAAVDVAPAATPTTVGTSAASYTSESFVSDPPVTYVDGPIVLFVEPSGAIGYGATLSPLVLIGLFYSELKYVYVDGISVAGGEQRSSYELYIPSIPAHPFPPHLALLHCGNGLMPDCEDTSLVRPVTVTLTYVDYSNEKTAVSVVEQRTLVNFTVVLDGLYGRPLLARYPTFTPLLLSSSTHTLFMTRPPRFTSDMELEKSSAAPSYYQRPTERHRLTAVVHPQKIRIAGEAQQDWEANISRFSVQLAAYTFADTIALAGLTPAVEEVLPASAAAWWRVHSTQLEQRGTAKDAMHSNVSILWTVGEVTGDLTTTTATRSLDVVAELYGLQVVLPTLTRTAHMVTLPALYDVAPSGGLRFMNQNCNSAHVYHELHLRGAFPRTLLILNEDVAVTLRPLRVPTFESTTSSTVALVDPTLEDCQATGESNVGDTLSCRASVESATLDASKLAQLGATDPLDTCGGGIVVSLFSAKGFAAAEASGAVLDWDPVSSNENLTTVRGFPKALPITSRVGLHDIFKKMPNVPVDIATYNGEWLVLRFSFVFQSMVSGVYRLHCDGSALHMQVNIRTGSDPDTVVHADCLQRPTDAAPFRHTVVDVDFDSESRLYINASCAFPWAVVPTRGEPTGEFCGVSLEAISLVHPDGRATAPLPSYAVYELRVPIETGAAAADVYAVALGLDEAAAKPLVSFTLPAVGSVDACHALPWRVVEVGGPYENGAAVGQRWGGLGFANVAFPSTVVSDAEETQQYCHLFLAFRLPDKLQSTGGTATTATAAQCPPLLALSVRALKTHAAPVQTQSVFCGSRSYFMDPITPLQLRIPLLEVPRLVELDSLVAGTEHGQMVYQYCIEVVFYDKRTGFTAAHAVRDPLVYTIVDTVDAPSPFCPSVHTVAPPDPANVSAGDTVYFTGTDLRYYGINATPLTGTRFTLELNTVRTYECDEADMMAPTGILPSLTAYLVNDTTLALPITADVPGGWFNVTILQGEVGPVVVDCSLTLRVASTIDSVAVSDLLDARGGTRLRVWGSNLPVFAATEATLTVGYPGESGTPAMPLCRVTASSGTLIECVTPSIDEDRIPTLAVYHEEDDNEYTDWLPLNLTIFYWDSELRQRTFQSININNTANGLKKLLVPFRRSKMSITSVLPLHVSCMSESVTLTVRGTAIASHSVLLCDVNSTSTSDTTVCTLCLPRAFSSEELVCDVLSSLPQGDYRVYVSDRALDRVTAFTVTSFCRVDTVAPAYLYPNTGSLQLSLIGDGFAWSPALTMQIVAVSGGVQRKYTSLLSVVTSTAMSITPPDLDWMKESGGTLTLSVVLSDKRVLECGAECVTREVRVLPSSQVPRIHSVSPYSGQAPLLLTIYGAGFTKLPHSPHTPDSVRTALTGQVRPITSLSVQETYIDVGGSPCIILGMLNTRIICNLTDPCANAHTAAVVHLVSRTYGTTAPFSDNTSSLFFNCVMRVDAVSHSTGSAAGGHTLRITGVGFPSNPRLLVARVGGMECEVQYANVTTIICTTYMMASATGPYPGPVVVIDGRTGQKSSCCSYTPDTSLMPMLASVSPTTAAAGARLLLFGKNFPNTTAVGGGWSGDGDGNDDGSSSSGELTARSGADALSSQSALMTLLFGTRRLPVTDIKSSTSAFVTVPDDFFGQDYVAVHVDGFGNSPRFMEGLFTVLVTPTVPTPSTGGYHGRVVMRLAGASVGSYRPAADVAELLRVFVCGRECEMLPTGSSGEVTCRTPTYMDSSFVQLYRNNLPFEQLSEGLTAYVNLDISVQGETGAGNDTTGEVDPDDSGIWSDVTALFTGAASAMYPLDNSASAFKITHSSVFIVLKAHMHSRLLFSNVTLLLSPTTAQANELDLSEATCRLRLATADAETAELFSASANPLNSAMWSEFDASGGMADYFTWQPLQLGFNTLDFTLLNILPTAAYIGIDCVRLPVDVLEITAAPVFGYQVGLYPASGNCPVNVRAQQRPDQPIMNSCPHNDVLRCPMFHYTSDLTPVVTRYNPLSALASDVGAQVTLYGTGFGLNISDVESIVLDRTACTPVSVAETELVCMIQGRVSTAQPWRVKWTSESGRGTAMLLGSQPFYATVAWSSYLAWMGHGLPKEGNIVVIPHGNSILLDVPPPPLTGLLLAGVLIVSDQLDLELRVGYMAITETGALIAGSEIQPHAHRFTLTLALNLFQDDALNFVNDIAGLDDEPELPYSRLLNVMGGTLQLHGAAPAVTRARLAQTAKEGDTSITLDRWVPWAVGDVVAVVTKHVALPHFIEQRTIVARVANATNTVLSFRSDAPLAHLHRAGAPPSGETTQETYADAAEWSGRWADAYAEASGTEVVYLTRTVVIRGDTYSPLSGVGASVWIHDTTKVSLEHVELYRMGKRGTVKGYSLWLDGLHFPLHTTVLNDVVVHDAYHRGVVLHNTRHVVLRAVTVLGVDGYGIAASGAQHAELLIVNGFLGGVRGNRGSLDTIAAGLFAGAADVKIRNTEIFASEGHGVWYALRLLFIAAPRWLCPGQNALAGLHDSRVHNVRRHGVLLYPLQFSVGKRCVLSPTTVGANDPMATSAAARAASAGRRTDMQLAGVLSGLLIFSCGLYGVYLPPSSGYEVSDSATIDCGAAGIFSDYTTSTNLIKSVFAAGLLPNGILTTESILAGTSSRDDDEFNEATQETEAVGCIIQETYQTAIAATHGGHLTLDSVMLSHVMEGPLLQLATLSLSSSAATNYVFGTYAAQRSAHLTIKAINTTIVTPSGTVFLLSGSVAVIDMDGSLTSSHQKVIFLFGDDAKMEQAPARCSLLPESQSSGGNEPPDSVLSDSKSDTETQTRPRAAQLPWTQGSEVPSAGVGGTTVVQIRQRGLREPGDDSSSSSGRQSNLWECRSTGKKLSLVFLEVTAAAAPVNSDAPEACVTVRAELREGDGALTVHQAALNRLEGWTTSTGVDKRGSRAGATAVETTSASFYLMSRDDVPVDGLVTDGLEPEVGLEATPRWRQRGTNESCADSGEGLCGAGAYTLESSTNLSLTFYTAKKTLCYPVKLTMLADLSLTWPTAELMMQVRVSPSTSTFGTQSGMRTECAETPLMGDVRWRFDENGFYSDPGAALKTASASTSTQSSDEGKEGGLHSAAMSSKAATSARPAWLTLALNPRCIGASTGTGTSGPWAERPSVWAAVEMHDCQEITRAGGGCIGPRFPYLKPFVSLQAIAANAPFVSWHSSAAWEDGWAPWRMSETATTVNGSTPAAFVIPFGTRVHLHLNKDVVVPGVLLVVGELRVTVESEDAPAASASSAASFVTERSQSGGTFATEVDPGLTEASAVPTPAARTLRVASLVVLGKLNVSATDETAPVLRIELGIGSTSAPPYQLDADTSVYPGTFYAAGEVRLTGVTSRPTTWQATEAVPSNTHVVPASQALTNWTVISVYCAQQVQLLAAATSTPLQTSDAMSMAKSNCAKAMHAHLPSPKEVSPLHDSSVAPWFNGSRIAVTSGTAFANQSEVNTVLQSRGKAGITNFTTASPWRFPHGGVYSHENTMERETRYVYSELVHLSQSVELECAIAKSSSEAGCMLHITRQRHPRGLLQPPRFQAMGVGIRHFGKGGQKRGPAPVMPAVAPLTFLPAVYVNVSSSDEADNGAARFRTTAEDWDVGGYAVLAKTVLEDSFGTAVYSAVHNTHLCMVDSAVWNSVGGGVRIDGGGSGVFMTGIIVAGTQYARGSESENATVTPDRRRHEPATFAEATPLTLDDTLVTSMCSVLINQSSVLQRSIGVQMGLDNVVHENEVAAVSAFVHGVVAAGSESEGFCLPWDGSGGLLWMARNTAHSAVIGVFLFDRASSLVGETLPQTCVRDTVDPLLESITAVDDSVGMVVSSSPLASLTTPSLPSSLVLVFTENAPSTSRFSHWTIYGNRYLGLYSSGHESVTITDTAVFANPIGIALALHPSTSHGNSNIADSYIATFPNCSCSSLMDSCDNGSDGVPPAVAAASVREWEVCQYSAYSKSRWTPHGCGPVTFVDETYHYAAVLVMPSYVYMPLSYPRDVPITSLSASMTESNTQGSLSFSNVMLGAVGELSACTSSTCCDKAGRAESPLRSAAFMGTGGPGLRSSASLSSIVLSRIRYAPSLWPPPDAQTTSSDDSVIYPSLLRLRPHTLESLTHSGVKGVTVTDAEEPGTASWSPGNVSSVAVADVLRAGRENPYGDTVVYDDDGTLFTHLNGSGEYIVRSAWSNNSVTALLSTLCATAPLTQEELLKCNKGTAMRQVRFRSLDTRAALQSLEGRLSLSLSTSLCVDAAQCVAHYTPTAMSVLHTCTMEESDSSNEATLPPLDPSEVEMAFMVPYEFVAVRLAPEAYPQAIEMRLAECDGPPTATKASVYVVLPLLDNEATVQVWSSRTQTLLPSVSGLSGLNSTTIPGKSTGSQYNPTAYGVVESTRALERWTRYVNQSSVTGDTVSSVVLHMGCGSRLHVHQLVYGMVMLYAPQALSRVKRGMRNSGVSVDIASLMPVDRFPNLDVLWFRQRLRVSIMTLYPDAVLGEGTWIILKVEASDSFAYDTDAAALAISEFNEEISANASFYDILVSAPAAEAVDALRERLFQVIESQRAGQELETRRAEQTLGDVEGRAGQLMSITTSSGPMVIVGGLPFSVVLTMPVLLPAELAKLQAILQASSAVVGAGTVRTSALVAFAVVVGLVLLILAACVGLRLCLPALRWRREAVAVRKAAGAPHTAAAPVLGPLDDGSLPPGASSADVVWVAGVLRTAVVATMNKHGVTACLEAGTVQRHTTMTTSTAATTKPARTAAAKDVMRQLLLLPSFNPLDSDAAAVSVTASDAPVPRVTEPQCSHAAARQRYLHNWRIAPHTMVTLAQRNSNARVVAAVGGGRGAGVMPSAGFTALPPLGTLWPSPRGRVAPPSPVPSRNGGAGAAAYGSRGPAEVSHHTSPTPQDGETAAAAATQQPTAVEPAIPVAPQFPAPPRFAAPQGACPLPSAVGDGVVADGADPAPLQSAAAPMALQSILATSMLTRNTTVTGASPSSLFPTSHTELDDTMQVLRGRGQILFTTPTVDAVSAATGSPRRALRLAMNAVLTPGDSSADDENVEQHE